MENKLLKFAYTFFLGIIIALFVGMGISTFYSEPKFPEYPQPVIPFNETGSEAKVTEASLKASREYEAAYKKYEMEAQAYHRNVSIISLVFAVLFVTISMLFARKNNVIMDGVMLGGVFVLLYSIGRGVASTDTKYTFIAVTISLIIVLFLGYRRFNNAAQTPAKKRKK